MALFRSNKLETRSKTSLFVFFSVIVGHISLGAKIIIRCLFSQSRSQFSTNCQGITVNVNTQLYNTIFSYNKKNISKLNLVFDRTKSLLNSAICSNISIESWKRRLYHIQVIRTDRLYICMLIHIYMLLCNVNNALDTCRHTAIFYDQALYNTTQ